LTEISSSRIATSIRKSIASIFTIATTIGIVLQYSTFSYFLSLSGVLGFGPSINILGVQQNVLSLFLFTIFLTTYVPDIMSDSHYSETLFLIILLIISSWIFQGALPFLFFIIAASLFGGLLLFLLTNSSRREIAGGILTYLSLLMIFCLTIRFTSYLTPLPQIFLASMGAVYLLELVLQIPFLGFRRPSGLK